MGWSESGDERGRRRTGVGRRQGGGQTEDGARVTAPRARPLPLIYGRPARAGGLRGLRARGPAHVPEARPKHGTMPVPGRLGHV